jgi:hypothetical protein
MESKIYGLKTAMHSTTKRNRNRIILIHKGLKTHHHDHVITPTSFSTTKIIVKMLGRPKPMLLFILYSP